MFRKIFSLFAICALVCSLSACSQGSKEPVMTKPTGQLGGEPGSSGQAADSQGHVTD